MNAPTLSPEQAAEAGDRLARLSDELGRVVLGQDDVLEQMLVTLVAGGHALLEGVPGTAKTLSIQALACAFHASFGRLQFTPDLMPTDVTGVTVFDESTRDFRFRPGPLFADLVLADEINRAPAKTQSALLEALAERQVTVDGVTHALPPAFTVFASQNPVEYEGTYPLPEAALDRFLLKIVIDYPSLDAELGILDRYADGFDSADTTTYGVDQSLTVDELLGLRSAVRAVRVESDVRRYVVELVRRTRDDGNLMLGASPRAAVAVFRASQAQALIAGRDFVVPEDVQRVAVPVMRHRLVVSPEAEVEGVTADDRVRGALDSVEAPGGAAR